MVNHRKIASHRDKIFIGYFSTMQFLLLGNSWEDFPHRFGAADRSEEVGEFEVSARQALDNASRLSARCYFPDRTE